MILNLILEKSLIISPHEVLVQTHEQAIVGIFLDVLPVLRLLLGQSEARACDPEENAHGDRYPQIEIECFSAGRLSVLEAEHRPNGILRFINVRLFYPVSRVFHSCYAVSVSISVKHVGEQ